MNTNFEKMCAKTSISIEEAARRICAYASSDSHGVSIKDIIKYMKLGVVFHESEIKKKKKVDEYRSNCPYKIGEICLNQSARNGTKITFVACSDSCERMKQYLKKLNFYTGDSFL